MRPRPQRLILWDIDGTLLWAGSAARDAFDAAVAEVLGRHPGDHGVQMSGKTDPQIALEIMEHAGVHADLARERLPQVLAALVRRTTAAAPRLRSSGGIHPGVEAVLSGLASDLSVLQSVLTGNLAPTARAKLAAFGLDRFLDLEVGAFGSDHHDRDELIPVSLKRVERRYGFVLEADDVWVVGDTPRDLACARVGGARCLLVGTGHIPIGELSGLGADSSLPDLHDVESVIAILTAG
jgi:phosphoglycolate phosphatase